MPVVELELKNDPDSRRADGAKTERGSHVVYSALSPSPFPYVLVSPAALLSVISRNLVKNFMA